MECNICCVFTDAPHTLPCGHLFCLECLQRIYSQGNIKCPDCRRLHAIRPENCTRIYMPSAAAAAAAPAPAAEPASPAYYSVDDPPVVPARSSQQVDIDEDEETRELLRMQQRVIDESHASAEARQLEEALAASWLTAPAPVRSTPAPTPVSTPAPTPVRSTPAPTPVRLTAALPRPAIREEPDESLWYQEEKEYYIPKPGFRSWFLYMIGIGKLAEPVEVVRRVPVQQQVVAHPYRRPPLNAIYTPRMNIEVKTLTGKTLRISISEHATILNLKRSIYDLEPIPPEEQRLIFAGKQLVDERKLLDYNIIDGSVIHLILRLLGD